MLFGPRPARTIRDPVLEPLWPGRRALVRVTVGGGPSDAIEIVDVDGLELAGHPDLRSALVEATQARDVVLDGHIVELPRRDAAGVFGGEPAAMVPGLAGATRQLVLGGRAGGRDDPGQARLSAAGAPGSSSAEDVVAPAAVRTVVAFVAVDVLAIDADVLLDVPLLERKRLLDSAFSAGERVRRSPHVRPPGESWYGQWRAFGFRQIAVKSANSRYVPGQPSEHWAVATLPRG